MAIYVALLSLITSIASIVWAAGSARRSSKRISRCTRLLKSLTEQLETPPSDVKLAEISAQVAHWSSISEKLANSVTKLNSRVAMRAIRAEPDTPEVPPVGAPKGELRRHYGLNVAGPEFAKRQLSLVPQKAEQT